MKTITKTFQEGDEVGIPIMFVNDVVWEHASTRDFVDPAEADYYLKTKITITIKIHDNKASK